MEEIEGMDLVFSFYYNTPCLHVCSSKKTTQSFIPLISSNLPIPLSVAFARHSKCLNASAAERRAARRAGKYAVAAVMARMRKKFPSTDPAVGRK